RATRRRREHIHAFFLTGYYPPMVSTPTLRPYSATGKFAPVAHRPSRPASWQSLPDYEARAFCFIMVSARRRRAGDALRLKEVFTAENTGERTQRNGEAFKIGQLRRGLVHGFRRPP